MTTPTGRCYLAGPVSGRPDLNAPAFTAAAASLRDSGWQPVSPHDLPAAHAGPCPPGPTFTAPRPWGPESHPYGCWMRAGLAALLGCDAVALLPGWASSPGVVLERRVAEACGLPVAELAALMGQPANPQDQPTWGSRT